MNLPVDRPDASSSVEEITRWIRALRDYSLAHRDDPAEVVEVRRLAAEAHALLDRALDSADVEPLPRLRL